MKINQIFPKMMFILGLAAILLAGPDFATAISPIEACADAGGASDITTSYINHDGWSGFRCENYRTGRVRIIQTRTDPQTGETIESDTVYNKKTGEFMASTTTTHKDKSKDKQIDLRPANGTPNSITDVHYDSQGHKTSVVIHNPDGSTETTTYDPQTGKRKSINVKHADGRSGTITFGPDGKPNSQVECDKTNNCISKAPDSAGGMNRFQAADKFRRDLGMKKPITAVEKPKTDLTRAKDKIKADVLGQIEGKPRGDLTGAKERVQTGLLDKPKSGALQVKPKAGDIVVGRKENLGAIPRSKPTGQVFQGADSARQKRQAGMVQPYKGKVRVQEPKAIEKKKLSVMPRSQSAGRMQSHGSAAANQRIQTPAVQPFKGKARIQDFRSPAGSSGPVVK